MAFGGAAWMATMSTFNTATQASAPPWVRSRAVAMHMVAALGAFAMGSAFWGAASDILGLTPTLCVAAALMGVGLLLARPMPLRMGALHEVTQATPWDELFIEAEPLPEAGPVAVEVGYRIAPGTDAAFLDTISRMKAPRRRDGATFWRVYKDLGEPSRYVERFIVASWADYLHQRARATVADRELETDIPRPCPTTSRSVEPMKHRTFLSSLLLALVFGLSACGQADPQAQLEAAVQKLQDNLEAKDTSAVIDQLDDSFQAQDGLDREGA
eukprot:gene26763-48182_t